jgi:hypothetical protein
MLVPPPLTLSMTLIMPIPSSPPVVPLDDTDRQTALQFAQQQPTPAKARQVYRNTLAVLTVKHCLDQLEIPTTLADSDCWNPFSRLAADVADLPVPGLGSLECRPVSPEESCCCVPVESRVNRIGYLVVQLAPPYWEAAVLGFSPQTIDENLSLKQLQPLEALLIHLEFLNRRALGDSQSATPEAHCLSQWLTQAADAGDGIRSAGQHLWQTVALGQPSALAFRSLQNLSLDTPGGLQKMVEQLVASQPDSERSLAVPLTANPDVEAALVHLLQTTTEEETRWKAAELLWTIAPGHPATGVRRVLDLGLLLAGHALALMVAVLQTDDRRLSILARVYPLTNPAHLPPKLQLAVLDTDGRLGLETQSRERDNYIQLKLRGELGEGFSLQLQLGTDRLVEHFVI